MFEAHGDGNWLYMSGKNKDGPGLDFRITLGAPDLHGFGDIVITGDYGEIVNLDARGLKKLNLTVTGTETNNRVLLTKEDDIFFGEGGRDAAKGRGGDDLLHGGDGRDKLVGNSGDDTLFGDNDDDLLEGNGGDDALYGGSGDDILRGGSGNDSLAGGWDSNRLFGGPGDDTIDGTGGEDVAVYDGNAADYDISLFEGNYRIIDKRDGSPDGTDIVGNVETLRFADGRVALDLNTTELNAELLAVDSRTFKLVLSGPAARSDTDELVTIYTRLGGGASVSYWTYMLDNGVVPIEKFATSGRYDIVDARGITGAGVSVGGNRVLLTDQADFLRGAREGYGFGGDDTMNGSLFKDTLVGGDGHDEIYGGEGSDILVGEAGNDLLFGGTGNDNINGGLGDDTIEGESGNDTIFGDEGNDRILGHGANDLIFAGAGDDAILGGTGKDTIAGQEGADRIYGGSEDDVLFGQQGNDTIDGGSGDDVVYFSGSRSEYVISEADGIIRVDGRSNNDDGIDTLTNVELLRFADQDVWVDSIAESSAVSAVAPFDALPPLEMIA